MPTCDDRKKQALSRSATALPDLIRIRFYRAALLFGLVAASPVSAAEPSAAALPAGTATAAISPAAVESGAGSAPPTSVAVKQEPVRLELDLHPALTLSERVITEDTVWKGEILVEGVVTVAPQTTLTIEPGTVVRFRRKGNVVSVLMVQGRLVAQGTKEFPVVLGSTFATPRPGDWQGVLLLASEKKNSLEYCRIEGAETALEVLFSTVQLRDVSAEKSGTGMRFQDSLVNAEDGEANDCGLGFAFSQSEANVVGLSGQGNARGIVARNSSLYLQKGNFTGNSGAAVVGDSCRVKIQGGSYRDNGSGITLTSTEGSISGTRMAGNRQFGLSLAGSRVRVNGNEIVDNRERGMVVADGAAVAWGNVISGNGACDIANVGTEEFRAPGNWWGNAPPKVQENGEKGRVRWAPALTARPNKAIDN